MGTELLRALLGCLVATFFNNFLLHTPKRALCICALMGMASYGVYWGMLQLHIQESVCMFTASLLVALLAESCARRLHMAATVFITTAIIPLVPGLAFYRFMSALAQGRYEEGTAQGMYAMNTILCIALAIAIASSIFTIIRTIKRRGHIFLK